MKKAFFLLVLLAVLFGCSAAAFASDEEAILIETTSSVLKKGIHGEPRADGEKAFVFKAKEGELTIPYEQVTRLEYGMKSRTTLGYSLLHGPYPKKVKDYMLTIDFKDEQQQQQTILLKLQKNKIWTTLLNLQNKTNKKIEFADEKAREDAMKSAPPGQIL